MKKIKLHAQRRNMTMKINREDLALSLKLWRTRKGLTQRELTERWKVSRYVILQVENAKPINWVSAYKIFALLAQELEQEKGII